MSMNYASPSSSYTNDADMRGTYRAEGVSDAKLRSLEIMLVFVSLIMILGPLAMGARSSMF